MRNFLLSKKYSSGLTKQADLANIVGKVVSHIGTAVGSATISFKETRKVTCSI